MPDLDSAPFPLSAPAPAHPVAVMLGLDDLSEVSAGEILDRVGDLMDGDGCMIYGDTRETAQHDNTRRARSALRAVAALHEAVSTPPSGRSTRGVGEPIETTITDLLANLMHLCDAVGVNFTDVTHGAAGLYRTELVGH